MNKGTTRSRRVIHTRIFAVVLIIVGWQRRVRCTFAGLTYGQGMIWISKGALLLPTRLSGTWRGLQQVRKGPSSHVQSQIARKVLVGIWLNAYISKFCVSKHYLFFLASLFSALTSFFSRASTILYLPFTPLGRPEIPLLPPLATTTLTCCFGFFFAALLINFAIF